MSLADWKSDLDRLILDFGSTLVWGGLEIPCVASDVNLEFMVEPVGDYTPKMKDVVATLSRFTGTIPDVKDTIILKEDSYSAEEKFYIETVDKDTKSDSIRLTVMRI